MDSYINCEASWPHSNFMTKPRFGEVIEVMFLTTRPVTKECVTWKLPTIRTFPVTLSLRKGSWTPSDRQHLLPGGR